MKTFRLVVEFDIPAKNEAQAMEILEKTISDDSEVERWELVELVVVETKQTVD